MAIRVPTIDGEGALIGATGQWVKDSVQNAVAGIKFPDMPQVDPSVILDKTMKDHGWLGTAAQLDGLDATGFGRINSGVAATIGAPVAVGSLILHYQYNNNESKQVLHPMVDRGVFERFKVSTVWQPWKPMGLSDTGWRELTLPEGSKGRLCVRRAGQSVYMALQGITLSGAGNLTLASLPTGWRPRWHEFFTTTAFWTTSEARPARCTAGGVIEVRSYTTGKDLNAVHSWHTADTFPAASAYPGTPV
ncbi:pyocin knob domain-containing protein [Kocuria sp.]|uniref:pyocin knob domain-containing protein n=1 Tax=Kocuria sp. TaxID=1871328 RepID=UPI0026DFC8C8|nr:pyocin knob domain-containing protein [Kocuria sp.]MDO5619263.1 pyocin knob domain-containing protein [Kocuria sp.]